MNFEGHDLYTINNNWVFDMTTFTCYRTYRDKKGNLTKVIKAIDVEINKDDETRFIRYVDRVPLGVMRKITKLIDSYMRDTFIK